MRNFDAGGAMNQMQEDGNLHMQQDQDFAEGYEELDFDDNYDEEADTDSEDDSIVEDDVKHKMLMFIAQMNHKSLPTSTIQNIGKNVEDVMCKSIEQCQKEIRVLSKKWQDGLLDEDSFKLMQH